MNQEQYAAGIAQHVGLIGQLNQQQPPKPSAASRIRARIAELEKVHSPYHPPDRPSHRPDGRRNSSRDVYHLAPNSRTI